MIGIICAMEIEMQKFTELLVNRKEEVLAGVKYYSGTIDEKEVILCNCGVGKVNAAMHTQLLIDKYHTDCILQSGIAGSLCEEVRQFDIVIGSELVYHDMQEFVLEQFSPLEKIYYADHTLVQKVQSCAPSVGVHTGRIATGDQFIGEIPEKERIRKTTQALCVEMEGCAVAHTAFLNSVPFVVIRSISDMADDDAFMTFDEFQINAAEKTVDLILRFLKEV